MLPEKKDPVSSNLPDRPERKSLWMSLWDYLSNTGLAEPALRLGTHTVLVISILAIAWGLREYYLLAQVIAPVPDTVLTNNLPDESLSLQAKPRMPLLIPDYALRVGIQRHASLHTDVPSRTRLQVITYLVQPGDTLFGIAAKFGLRPETLLWANQPVLGDDPHNLRPGQELLILPVDGTYHRWSAGDSLVAVAGFFNVRPEDIVNFPPNHLDPTSISNLESPEIPAGTWLIIPGGRREFVSWSAPDIPRDNPAVARVLGPGACDSISDGVIGSGQFIWPANSNFLTGYDYDPGANHFGMDINGAAGEPVFASDSGVVVYAGWNNWGYGFMIVINHGNGWQTLYAHLDAIYMACGQSVEQGTVMGTIGASGNASEPHLHFEMMFNGSKVNPHNYIQ